MSNENKANKQKEKETETKNYIFQGKIRRVKVEKRQSIYEFIGLPTMYFHDDSNVKQIVFMPIESKNKQCILVPESICFCCKSSNINSFLNSHLNDNFWIEVKCDSKKIMDWIVSGVEDNTSSSKNKNFEIRIVGAELING